MRLTDPLNDRQLEVLRWIADGCPEGVMIGHSYKVTARALRDRQLVRVSRRSGTWSATVTDTGSYYLMHKAFPPPRTGQSTPAATTPRPRSASKKPNRTEGSSDDNGTRRSESPPRPRKRSPTEQLVADVVAAGGVLKVPRNERRSGWWGAEELARNANRHGKTPPGKRLVHEVVHEGEGWRGPRFDVFSLEEGPIGTDAPLLPVPVPDDVARYHHAVSVLRKSKRLPMAATVEARALRILHGVAVEAEHRGFTVTAQVPKSNSGRHGQPAEWHLLLAINGETVPLRIEEETDRVKHMPTPRELKEHERRPWISIPTYHQVPSGRLRVEIGGPSERKSFWADRTSWRLEDKLSELLREVAVRANELRLRREAQTEATTQYQKAVKQEERRAQARAGKAHRKKVLEDQLIRWRAAQELRQYAAAMAERIAVAEAEGQEDRNAVVEARRWLTWVTKRAERQDPLTQLPTWPTTPKLHAYELHKFMEHVPEPTEMQYMPESY